MSWSSGGKEDEEEEEDFEDNKLQEDDDSEEKEDEDGNKKEETQPPFACSLIGFCWRGYNRRVPDVISSLSSPPSQNLIALRFFALPAPKPPSF